MFQAYRLFCHVIIASNPHNIDATTNRFDQPAQSTPMQEEKIKVCVTETGNDIDRVNRVLRGYPRADLAADNHYLVRGNGSLDLRAPIGNWRIIAEARLWEPLLAMLRIVFRSANPR